MDAVSTLCFPVAAVSMQTTLPSGDPLSDCPVALLGKYAVLLESNPPPSVASPVQALAAWRF